MSLYNYFSKRSDRTQGVIKNIGVSFVAKVVTILCSLLIVPLTIDYIDSVQYGIWLSLSSIITNLTYFNLGLSNGFRNKFAEARAVNNDDLAQRYVSTTYASLGVVVFVLLVVSLLVNANLNWANILKVDSSYYGELRSACAIIIVVFLGSMIANIFKTMLTADQKPGVASIIDALSSIFSVVCLLILLRSSEGSITNLALYYAGVPCIVVIISSIIGFCFTRYRSFRPSFKTIDKNLVKNILSLGIQFFFINISLVLIFQMLNIVISREIGPEAVTQYNISYKYFHLLYVVYIIIITPFWSAFTNAYKSNEIKWMNNVMSSLEKICILFFFAAILMTLLSQLFFKLWIGDSVYIPLNLNICVAIYIYLQVLSSTYMYLINGIGTIRLQLIIYIAYAIVAWPLISYSCRYFGIYGIVIFPSVVYLTQAIVCRIQLKKIMHNSATGLWVK